MRVELAAHDEVLRLAIETHGGWLFKHTGDGVCAAFASAQSAIDAAVEAQRNLGLPVRMGVASGEAELRGDDYFGPTLNTAARVMAAGHGGQILLAVSSAVLASGVELLDLGPRSLRDLSASVQLFQVRADGLRAEFPALRTVDVVPGNLPLQESSFVGRSEAVTTIVDAVGEHRVVTLIGVGGVGKTRLALQSAAMLAPRFRDGVWLIELASVTAGAAVDAAVASAFTLQPQPGRAWRDVVVDGLRGREALLVIDNCEHVLDQTAALVEALAECPSIRVMVTSREALTVRAEWAWRVPSLAADAAAELFVERADTAASGFRPSDTDLVVIGEVCDRLDGIALAIELAAARVRSMSPTQIRDRLDERFRLLTGSRRSIERHQTLRHAVQWSYDLLEPVEQTVLQRASVFVGGFSLEALAAIGELDEYEALDILDSLVRKSLLHVDRADSEVRYAMLETIRQFAEEALAIVGMSDEIRDCHADYFADRADDAWDRYPTEEEPLVVKWVAREMTNLAAGFQWALSRGLADPALRIATMTHRIARISSRTDTFDWPEQVLPLARQIEHRQLPRLLTEACDAATGTGRLDDAVRYGLEAIELNDDDRYDFAAHADWCTAMALFVGGAIEQSLRTVRAGAEHPADHPLRVNLLYLHVLAHMGAVAIPERESIEAIAELKASTMPTVRAGAFWVQANLVAGNDPPAAIALYQQAIDVGCANSALAETCRSMQLELIVQTDDLDAAFTGFTHVVDAWQTTRGDIYTGRGMGALVNWLARLGYHDGATRLFGALMRGRPPELWINSPAELVMLPKAMGEAAFVAAFEAGAAMDVRAVAELACTLLAQARHELTGT